MENLKEDILKLKTYLELEREIVGIKFLFEESDFNEFQGESFEGKKAYCTMVRDAMRGRKIKAELKNFACLSAAKALGLMDTDYDDDSGLGRVKIGTYKNLTIGRSVSKDMVYCKHRIYGVGIMPLDEYDIEPDVVIIVTNPYNVMRLVQGYAYNNGQAKNIKLAGMQAICQECTSYPFEINDLNISTLCAGTRLLAQWGKDEMGLGLPFYKFHELIMGVENTINPIERNKDKKIIEEKISKSDLEEKIEIIYNKNYDDGLYGGI